MIFRAYRYFIEYFIWTMRFKKFGNGSRIYSPLKINGPERINIGSNVLIQYKSWLAAMPLTNDVGCELCIGDGSVIGHFNHIYATRRILIGKKVLLADKVYISDNIHGYADVTRPVMDQGIVQKDNVQIGDGCWIGENVCIIGASVGRQSVIGSNSVVTKSIPDYCVAVGNPARIIKRFDHETHEWKKTLPNGEFV